MKKILITLASLALAVSAFAQDVIRLPQPDKNVAMPLYQALAQRASAREYSDTPISEGTLSQLLWAACGVNREDGKLTVPSAMNTQEELVYVCRKDGAWLFNAKENTLNKVCDKDIRKDLAGRQTSVAEAPLFLVIVCDLNKYKFKDSKTAIFGAIDAGYVSQNICLACEALGLSTVPRGSMDHESVRKSLGLADGQELLLNHPVGYRKKVTPLTIFYKMF